MLQKVDRDRLDKVLEVIKTLKIKYPNATLERDLKANSGNISAYLKGTKPISDNFYNAFMDKYVNTASEIKNSNDKVPSVIEYSGRFSEEILRDVARSGAVVGEANKIIGEANRVMAVSHDKLITTNAELVSVIKMAYTQANLKGEVENQKSTASELQSCLELIAKLGVEKKWFENEDEGLVELGKCVFVNEPASKVHDMKID